MNIHYNHKYRLIQDDDGKEYSYEEAVKLVEQGRINDWNVAFSRLMNNDGDMEAVEKFYSSYQE